MSLKIGVVSQKGGVGKSTLVRSLAVEYARNEWRVLIADMDIKQRTVTEWNCLRMDNGVTPTVDVHPYGRVKDAIKNQSLYDLVIFDGVGQADGLTAEICQVSDLIVLPSGVGRDDLVPQIKLAHEIVKVGINRKQICFVLSRVGTSQGELDAAREFIEEAGYYYSGFLPERTSISQSHDRGQSAAETQYPSINSMIDEVIQQIGNRIELLTNK